MGHNLELDIGINVPQTNVEQAIFRHLQLFSSDQGYISSLH